jgi:nitrite reductase/ring-hydroxylating ferredoxin subunit/DMSO/TMAO reductase YedYZ heme-binding membrane subunit
MSSKFVPVMWNRTKYVYDAALVLAVGLYLVGFVEIGTRLQSAQTPLDAQTLLIRAFGTCAFLMLTLALAIGPLARLDRRFLPLLYNRRHLGVATCLVAIGHAYHVLGWYFAYSPLSPGYALLAADTGFSQFRGFPFIPFGIAALAILAVLAATSHDFWLAFLTAPVWKALHMSIYAAYTLVVLHVSFGALQDTRSLALPALVMLSAATLAALHIAAARKTRAESQPAALHAGWVDAGAVADFAEDRAVVVAFADAESVAIFRHADRLNAVSNVCAHQNGPLGEGRIVDGCITCPWHGFQYRLEDGCAPPPFTEKIATYNLALADGRVLLDPVPNAPGTPTKALALDEAVRP